jgi:predicted 3-demethylubiquinone-9 3-methyltransferase (glyoxalase superfamily)
MQKITPFLWFDRNAEEAMNFYVSVFKNSKISNIKRYPEGPLEGPMKGFEGQVLTGVFELEGQQFMCLDGGPIFKLNPSVSFLVVCKTVEEVDSMWATLGEGGKALMEIGEYPFSKRYGWTDDKYGVSWQIILDDGHYAYKHKITPTLMFVGSVAGRAEEAMNFYASVFPDSKMGEMARYPAGMAPEKEGTIMHGAVTLAGQEFFAMDSEQDHKFNFNESTSFLVDCKDQEEIDYFWNKFTADGGQESQCGWCKDKFGFSWQVVPDMSRFFNETDPERAGRAMHAMLGMKKIIIADLEKAYNGA